MKTLEYSFEIHYDDKNYQDSISKIIDKAGGNKYDLDCDYDYDVHWPAEDDYTDCRHVCIYYKNSIREGCDSLKGLTKLLGDLKHKGFVKMEFKLKLTGDVDDVIKHKHAIQLPNSTANINCRLCAKDLFTFKVMIKEIEKMSDNIFGQYCTQYIALYG